MFRVAEIPYLNCAPFYWNKEPQQNNGKSKVLFKWIRVPPKKLGIMAKKGKLDAGPVSLVDSFELENDFEPLSDLGIAVQNSAKSVLLFSKLPLNSLDKARVGISSETVTSTQLLKVLLKRKYNSEPNFKTGFSKKDHARLLIGDGALKAASNPEFYRHFYFIYDLGEEWKKWMKLPFVFARWMVRKNVQNDFKEQLSQMLNRNIDSGFKKLNQVVLWHRDRKGWNNRDSGPYLKEFSYHLGQKEKKAITLFKKLLTNPHSSNPHRN